MALPALIVLLRAKARVQIDDPSGALGVQSACSMIDIKVGRKSSGRSTVVVEGVVTHGS